MNWLYLLGSKTKKLAQASDGRLEMYKINNMDKLLLINAVSIRDTASVTSAITDLSQYAEVYYWVINNTDQDMKVTIQPAVENDVTAATPRIFDGIQWKDADSLIIPPDSNKKPYLLNTVGGLFDISYKMVRFSVRSNGAAPTLGAVSVIAFGVKR